MSKNKEELLNDVSHEFLFLQKGKIIEDLCKQIKQRQKLAAEKEKQTKAPAGSSNQLEALAATSEGDSTYEEDPSSNAKDSQNIGDEDTLEQLHPGWHM
ncbi:uncharacterized protein PGTG_01932 [Puccinia graminis f. sp. tritici CRL 75-36-700-3]|uniref:Uncharacterized protein n=2 Tax=Puccinia graminis f. sp. tritici TaxID=56615 RepID=E3JT60_PUCGT|nr:uncharacterized protein PGTG_01932 [Puccinia graminis f. sp. tritici CRL 75-36-700-3]EFP75339.2 hypothetical protein PGTG_01932 [Puccinia graminis f. sp. tritici CRL 75-36-700-3]